MKLLLHTRFWPSVGGIETVAELLAREWVKQNVAVTILTDVTAPDHAKTFPFPVHYRPKARTFLNLMRKHDVFMHFNVSLRAIWPLLIVPRPFIAVHHGFYVVDEVGRRDWREKLKLLIAKRATENIAVSKSIAKTINIPCQVIANPFEADVYRTSEQQSRTRDLVFLGRLVSSKGAHILIQALSVLKKSHLEPNLMIIGEGPERKSLENLARSLGLDEQVAFAGKIPTENVAALLCEHKILIVPSIWNEGFGVVALEGIASGCAVISSDSGGLREAVGNCGLVVRTGDVHALALAIERLLTNSDLLNALRSRAVEHLPRHFPAHVAERYLAVISPVLPK